jgi:16S rRNA (uracil1498-N3)-methyltransferase
MSLAPIRPFTDSPVHILVGPEGGFTREEVSASEKKGFIVISLGKRILRAETASISSTTLVQFLLGDLG